MKVTPASNKQIQKICSSEKFKQLKPPYWNTLKAAHIINASEFFLIQSRPVPISLFIWTFTKANAIWPSKCFIGIYKCLCCKVILFKAVNSLCGAWALGVRRISWHSLSVRHFKDFRCSAALLVKHNATQLCKFPFLCFASFPLSHQAGQDGIAKDPGFAIGCLYSQKKDT